VAGGFTPPVPCTGSVTSAAMFSGPISATVRAICSASCSGTRAVSGTSDSVP
jgi:hypothetical protein